MFWGSVGVSAAVLATGLVAVARSEPVPAVVAVRALAPAPLAVTMNVLDTGHRVAMGGRVTVSVEAIGTDVDALTLWDDDRLVATFEPESPVPGVGHTFEWLGLRPGPHLLHATAHGSKGTAHSAPVGVEVFLTSTTPTELPVSAPSGTTAAMLAAATGVDEGSITADGEIADATAPGAGSAAATRPAFVVDAPAVAEAAAADLADSAAEAVAGVGTDVIAGSPDTGDSSDDDSAESSGSDASSAPGLTAQRDGCAVSVRVQNATGSLVVYHATSGAAGFTEIATVDGDQPVRLEDLGPGSHVFTAGPAGEPTTLAPVAMSLPSECVQSWWKGDASIVNGILTIAEPTDDAMWVFLSVDGKPATRLPAESLQSFRASTRRIDVTPWLPSLSGRSVHLEVWAYAPGDDAARKIGTGDADLPEGMSPAQLIGESARSWVTVSPDPAKVSDATLTAKWGATSPRADRVLWQVTTQPQSQGNTSLQPPGLVASGISVATSSDAKNGVAHAGTFTIPVTALALPTSAPIVSKPVTLQQVGAGSGANLPSVAPKLIVDPLAIDLDDLAAGPIGDPEVEGGVVSTNLPVLSGSTYFVRVIPFSGTTPLGGTSPADRIDLPAPTDPPQKAMDTTSIAFDAGRAPNYDLRGCIRVTAVPWPSGGTDWTTFEGGVTRAFFPQMGTFCPGDWQSDNSCWAPDVLCDAWDVLVEGVSWVIEQASTLWDLIAAAYNGIIDLAVNIIARFNPYCIQAAIAAKAAGAIGFKSGEAVAGAASDFCDKMAPIVARAAVGAVLAVVGLPPALPTSDQLKAIAEGNLVELAVVYLEQLGIPCGDLTIDADTAGAVSSGVSAAGGDVPPSVADGVDVCRDALGAALGKVKEQVSAQAQQQIRDSTGLPLPSTPIPGFEFELEPRARYRNPSIAITATARDGDIPVTSRCDAWLTTTLVKPSVGDTKKPTFTPVKVSLGRQLFTPTWSAAAQFPFNPATGYDGNDYNLSAGTALTSSLSSQCLGDGKGVLVTGAVSPPRGRWAPGEDD